MKTFSNFKYFDLQYLYIHSYFKIGSKGTFYEFIDLAREFPDKSSNYNIIIIGKNPGNSKYRVYKYEDLEGQKVVILNESEFFARLKPQS